MMDLRYFCKPCRLSSVSASLLTVRRSQDLAGKGAGGGWPVCATSSLFKFTKSVYRFLISCFRSGNCRVTWYTVKGLLSDGVAVEALGIEISNAGAMVGCYRMLLGLSAHEACALKALDACPDGACSAQVLCKRFQQAQRIYDLLVPSSIT